MISNRQGKSPFSLDGYLSWMSRNLTTDRSGKTDLDSLKPGGVSNHLASARPALLKQMRHKPADIGCHICVRFADSYSAGLTINQPAS
jgi:hypothetical protein